MVEATLPIWKDTCEHCGRGFDSGEPVLCRFPCPEPSLRAITFRDMSPGSQLARADLDEDKDQ